MTKNIANKGIQKVMAVLLILKRITFLRIVIIVVMTKIKKEFQKILFRSHKTHISILQERDTELFILSFSWFSIPYCGFINDNRIRRLLDNEGII